MSVEQDSDFLNLKEEEGDAFMAWAVLSSQLEDAPEWVRVYFQRIMDKIDEFDPHDDLEIALTHQLEVPVLRARPHKPIGAKSKHDYALIFDWVDEWMRSEDAPLEDALWQYVEVFELDPDVFETIKSAYHRVRRARLNAMDQERPHWGFKQRIKDGDGD
ncbi:hypothetical protein [Ruegeria sp.]|uniref:hypothetical protein n=1 Tax=Ruegeria sp. TaxID=1879320 RepID=UPI003C7976C8